MKKFVPDIDATDDPIHDNRRLTLRFVSLLLYNER